MNITIPIEIKDERVKDLLCCAFEGGSNYWIKRVETPDKAIRKKAGAEYWHESPVVGLELVITRVEGDGKVTLTKAKLEDGFKLMAKAYPSHFANFLSENEDAETGDVYLQLCCFGEVVYG